MPLALLLLAAFVALTGLVHADLTNGVDHRFLHRLQQPPFTSTSLHDAFTVLVTPGDAYLSAALIACGCLLLLRRGRRLAALAYAAALVVTIAVELACKLVVAQLSFTSPERIFGVAFSSYPSGHMARCVLLAALAGSLWPRLRPLIAAWLLSVPAGILILRMHLLSDVVGGALLGSGLALLSARAGALAGRRRDRAEILRARRVDRGGPAQPRGSSRPLRERSGRSS